MSWKSQKGRRKSAYFNKIIAENFRDKSINSNSRVDHM